MSKYIDKLGIELEGGWTKGERGKQLFPDVPHHFDRSVEFRADTDALHIGELASPPMSLEAALEWLKAHYPQRVNASCGYHIHTSLIHNSDYSRLASKRFYQYYLEAWQKWGEKERQGPNSEFTIRLAGRNRFARRTLDFIGEQITAREKPNSRRAHLNFCYGLHQTLENRMLPMFRSIGRAGRALKFHHDMIEEYLAQPFTTSLPTITVTD